ncbi:MAG: MoaD/ThiS family protein [Sulfuricaulis sp.]|uniref:MoaD/ThiS family protein n=1 Tax=Sulfuricaulis sp. TaxID=2003553 RepID=UPI0025EC4183|nr:MoaD/ThiS family protein [Sulfuricaulis sp.]MCR4348100.1 MoaD/ThiS family protein [Sulfuricaulis sp.]
MAKILYFLTLVDKVGSSSEEVALPESVADLCALLEWLRARGGNWENALKEDTVQVTVNRQFAVVDTAVNDKMEIAIVPACLK